MQRRLPTKKILVATLGAGAVSYVVACGSSTTNVGNLMPTPGPDATADTGADAIASSGNLLPPQPPDAAQDAPDDSSFSDVASSGNLVPPPIDGGTD
jgi:hypothetical protein